MYFICFVDYATKKLLYEKVSGEDAMHIRVDEIVKSGVPLEDISVFDSKYELDSICKDKNSSENDETRKITEILDRSLALAGYKIMDGDGDSVLIRNSHIDRDFEIKVIELF
jgi:hypothetical protein